MYASIPAVRAAVATIADTAPDTAPDAPPAEEGFWRGDFYFEPTEVGYIVTAESELDDQGDTIRAPEPELTLGVAPPARR